MAQGQREWLLSDALEADSGVAVPGSEGGESAGNSSPADSFADALRSVANFWNLKGFSLPFSPDYSLETRLKSVLQSQEPGVIIKADEVEVHAVQEKMYISKFESTYVHISVPLYQEFWMNSMKKELHKIHLCSSGLKSPSPASPTFVLSPPGLQTKSYVLWQDLPETKGILNSLSQDEIRLQEAMFELIVSEASYQKSLRVALNVFQSSKELKQILSHVQQHFLFSNLIRVCRVSERFLQNLESHLDHSVVMSDIGIIVCNHQQDFQQVYEPYITNMMYQEALITQLLRENKKFALILKKLERDPECQRQSLKSFLVLPFQRITRLTLLLENIMKRSKGVSQQVPCVHEAIQGIRKILEDCDKNVQQLKRTEVLVSLNKVVDFGHVKSVPIVTRGRYLLEEGPLKQLIVGDNHKVHAVTWKHVYMHLFNDLLLLSVKSGDRFVVQDHAPFPGKVRVEEIKTEVLSLPPDSFLLHLRNGHSQCSTALVLTALTRLKKDYWIKVLSSK